VETFLFWLKVYLAVLGIAAVIYFGWLIAAALSDGKIQRPDFEECGRWAGGILIGGFVLIFIIALFR